MEDSKTLIYVVIAVIAITIFIAISWKTNTESVKINENLDNENSDNKHYKTDELVKEEYSDRELQEQILKTLKLNQEDNRAIKFWVVFWSWLSIIGLALYIFIILTALD
jgi:hypothetical protein